MRANMNYHRTVFLVIAVALTMGSATYAQSKNHGDHKKKSIQAEKFTAAEGVSNTGRDVAEVTEVRPILNLLFYIAGEDGELTLEELDFALDKFEALRFEFEEDPEAVILIEELAANTSAWDADEHGNKKYSESGTYHEEEQSSAWDADEHGDEQSCGSTDTPATPVDCTVTGSGWQEVSNVLSEENCQFGYTDAVQGPQRRVIYDNSYSVACVGENHEPSVYVGFTPEDSNWGAFVQPSKTCQMKTGTLPSNSSKRVVEKIVCPGL
jgi:hypothetical protein